jgi:hypothetical protein
MIFSVYPNKDKKLVPVGWLFEGISLDVQTMVFWWEEACAKPGSWPDFQLWRVSVWTDSLSVTRVLLRNRSQHCPIIPERNKLNGT